MKKRISFLISVFLLIALIIPALGVYADGEMSALKNLKALGGSWSFGDEYTCSGSGDMFALSETTADSFVFKASATFKNRTGAVSLVFFSSDNPSRGSYVANIDLGAGNARIFKFESAGGATTKGEYILPASLKSKSTFELRVEVAGDSIVYYLNGYPAVHITDSSAKPGKKLGLLTFNTSASYKDVQYADYGSSAPSLDALAGDGISFSGQSYMKASLPYGTKEYKLTASAPAGQTVGASIPEVAGSADISVSGSVITLKNISGDTVVIISVKKGEVMRSYAVEIVIEPDPDTVYNEQWRSQFHFSPLKNWLNDPNGLVFDPSDSSYHLFFQYNPYGLNIANQVWGHAVSTDLIHWKELDVAIPQDSLGAVFSGSALVDEDNTSGFFTDNKPGESKLVAIYTSDGGDTTHGVEKQCIAYSKDHGVTWIKPTLEKEGFENPILPNDGNKYGRDFRDPKIFRYDGKWFMAVAGGRARLFTSSDLIHWTQVCDMGFDSECPDFYPLAVDGDSNNIKWVYTASGKWYVIGRLEKVSDTSYKFVQEGERITYNGGNEVYATQSYFNDGSGSNRRIAISWIQDSSASSLAGKTWNGAMTLPLEQTLRTVNGKIILTSCPVAELNALRGTKVIDLKSTTAEKLDEALRSNPGSVYDAEIVFKPESGAKVTFTLRSNGANHTDVVYDNSQNRLSVIRTNSSSAKGVPSSTMSMPLYPDKDGNIRIRIVMDKSVIEVFGNNGEAPCTGMIFPGVSGINSSLEVSGKISVSSFVMYRMKSIWHHDCEVTPAPGVYVESITGDGLDIGEEATFKAYVIDESGKRVDGSATFEVKSTDIFSVISNSKGVLKVKGLKKGSAAITAKAGSDSVTFTVTVSSRHFDTNLSGWTSQGDWYIGENGYTINGSSGDSFAFSNKKNGDKFVYSGEANLTGLQGCLGLVFAVTNPEKPGSGTWYGANIDTHGSKPVMKLFCNRNGQEIWRETYTFDSNTGVWKLEVRYEDGVVTYSVNGKSVTHKVANLGSGSLGLVSWSGGGSFDNVSYSSLETPEPPVTDKPTTDKPTTDKPVTDKPVTDNPVTDKPVTDKPNTDTPSTDKPVTDEPVTDKPTTGEPSTDKTGTDKPDTDKPGTDKPDTDEPGTDKPDTDKPSTGEPSTGEPSTDEPSTGVPVTDPDKNPGTSDKESPSALPIVLGCVAVAVALIATVSAVVISKKKGKK